MPGLCSGIEQLLPFVETPGQYIGAEVNAARKDPARTALSVCLAFPDTYAVGMSHVGLKILYEVLNRQPDIYCERAFAPWSDMAVRMRSEGIGAFSLETHRPLAKFDVIGFSLQYELNATNVLFMLDLAGLPLRAAERSQRHPLILGGGPLAFNPEPLAPFFDLFIIGEAEEAILELAGLIMRAKSKRTGRKELLLSAAREIAGVYVPALYEPRYSDGRLVGLSALEAGVPAVVRRRVVKDLDASPFPTAQVVPNVSIVHERLAVEIMRGCTHGCRFCQASSIYRPLRTRKPETIRRLVRQGLAATGYNEVGLLSLSSGDYPGFVELLRSLMGELAVSKTSLSLPSLRITPELIEIPEVVSVVRKSGLTFAPESATDRLRAAINKDVSNDELLAAVEAAWSAGWETIKLYFMLGLPGENNEDLAAIPELLLRLAHLKRKFSRRPGRLNVSLATFVPKPHTAFQWAAIARPQTIAQKQELVTAPLQKHLSKARISVKTHQPYMSLVEALIARGERRVSDVIERAYRAGEIFSAWDEHFHYQNWQRAAHEAGLDVDDLLHRERDIDEFLAWEHIDIGIKRQFLLSEWQKARSGIGTPDCRYAGCQGCGACD